MIMEAAVTLLFVFLVLLVLRYALFLWLGYLHHMENRAGAGSDDATALPRLTVVVPVYNEAAVIQGALRSLLTLDYPSYDILVVDDGSTDDTRELAARLEGQHGRATLRVVSRPPLLLTNNGASGPTRLGNRRMRAFT